MRFFAGVVCLCAALLAQAPVGPVVNPRGVINAFTQQPAPSVAAPGGILHIQGLSLGPPGGAKAAGAPLPLRLADPAVEVLINGKPVPLFSASPELIVAQVPWDATAGLATVVVRRGGAESRPARVLINQLEPAIRTTGDKGFGEAAGSLAGTTLTLSATGLGPTQPRVGPGEAGPQEPPARPRQEIRAYVGGLSAAVTAALSTQRVGEFDVRIQAPPAAQPGDIVTLVAGNRPANRATFQKQTGAEVRFLALPEGAPELRGLVGADLRGSYMIGSGARGEDGCYPSYVFDLGKLQATKIDTCLTTGNRNARTPVVAAAEGSALAALVGPPEGEPPAGVSAKVIIFDPAKEQPMTVDLPEPAVALASAPGGDFAAVIGGTPARTVLIDAETGEVRAPAAAAAGAAAGGAGAAFNPQVDLGDGLTHVLAMAQLQAGVFAVVVGDSADQPTKAKVAVINRQGEVQGSADFPEGWVPLVAPAPPQRPGAPPDPRAGAALLARRVTASFDGEKRVFYVLARRGDDSRHGVAAFSGEGLGGAVVSFPEGWFAAACSPNIPFYNLELGRKLVLLGSRAAEKEFKDPCPGAGFIVLDLEAQTAAAVPLPGQGQFDADPSSTGDLNDFIYGSNTDPSRRNLADTLFVLDGVTASAFQMALPAGVTTFANPVRVPAMNALVALAANRAAGDAGLIYFDLERAEARMLPTPEGFAQVNLLGIFTTTRKLVARGVKAGGTGSQYLIYDLLTGDLLMPANPEGVAAVGGLVGAAGQPDAGGQPRPPAPGGAVPPGQAPQPAAQPVVLQQANPKANTIAAVGYTSDGKQAGVLVVRVP
ncbi:MAG: hypothetical protein AAB225_27700 [Acidobacteriota bacterium]